VRQTIPVSWFNRNISYNENFWRFLLPGFLLVLTILLGYNGFLQLAKEQIAATDPTATTLTQTEKLDIFFNAVNLISLNSSTLQVARVPLVLNIARFTGLLFVLNAFIVAFMLAIGSNNKNLLRFFFWRLFRFRNIQMIMGLNTQSYALAMALKQQGGRVVMIDK